MTEQTPNSESEEVKIDLNAISDELRQVILFDDVPEAMYQMIVSIHQVSEEVVKETWETLPQSAQNVLDNFEQFHALVSVSQAFAGMSMMEQLQNMGDNGMTTEAQEEYRAQLIDKAMVNCIKDISKQLKKARRDPILKREFIDVFTQSYAH